MNCEHDCKKSLEGGVCTCPEGKKVANDTRTCVGEENKVEWKRVKTRSFFFPPKHDLNFYFNYFCVKPQAAPTQLILTQFDFDSLLFW